MILGRGVSRENGSSNAVPSRSRRSSSPPLVLATSRDRRIRNVQQPRTPSAPHPPTLVSLVLLETKARKRNPSLARVVSQHLPREALGGRARGPPGVPRPPESPPRERPGDRDGDGESRDAALAMLIPSAAAPAVSEERRPPAARTSIFFFLLCFFARGGFCSFSSSPRGFRRGGVRATPRERERAEEVEGAPRGVGSRAAERREEPKGFLVFLPA